MVLLDEIEKAHPDVFNILLQVLDDGRLTDNKGRTVDFRNTIIIMTSNIGSHIIQENYAQLSKSNADQIFDRTRDQVFELLKQSIRPEFLNRVDEIIMFTPLNRDQIKQIVLLQFDRIKQMLAQNGVSIEITDSAVEWITDIGFDPVYGARPIKRVMQKKILNELSKQLLAGTINKEQTITVDYFGDDILVFR